MASAYLEFPIAEEEELVERHEGSDLPIASMPHLEHTGEELDGLHPSLIPPDDEALEDTQNDADDCVYSHGLELAERLRQDTASHGRKRRTVDTTTATVNNIGGSRGQPLRQPLRTPRRVDNPGVQTADGFGPVRAPGQPHAESAVQDLRNQVAANMVRIRHALEACAPQLHPHRSEGSGLHQGPPQHEGSRLRAGSPRLHLLRPLSDLVRLHPSSRLELPRRRSAEGSRVQSHVSFEFVNYIV